MAAPVLQKAWTLVVNQRIPIASYATLILQGGRYLKLIADSLLANGHTCKGSCDQTTGTMDGTNRWNTDANASHQAANTTSPVSWLVLTDGNGANVLLSFVGATGDIARISYSPGGLYVVAGTATHTPTATDEIVLFTGISLITSSLVNDRVLHVWVDSTAKLCRTCCFAAGTITSGNWGVELVNANRTTIAFSPAMWGFAFTAANLTLTASTLFAAYAANSIGGQARINGVTCNVFCGAEAYNAGSFITFSGLTKPELQKGIGVAMFPILIGTVTATRQGPIGNPYDWWTGKNGANSGGDVIFPGGQWIQLSTGNSGPVWPWDNATIPQVA